MIHTETPNRVENVNLTSKETEALESVLRGENSAIEAYMKVMEKVDTNPEIERLSEFLHDHKVAASFWGRTGISSDVKDATNSGIWGDFVKAFVGGAKLFGNTSALKALKEGEEHGLSEYQDLLENDNVSASHKEFIRETLIPNTERHISSINAMMKMQ